MKYLIALLIPCLLYAENPFHNRPMPGVEWKIESQAPSALDRRLNAESDLLELEYAREIFKGIMPGTRPGDIQRVPPRDTNLSDLIIILELQEEIRDQKAKQINIP